MKTIKLSAPQDWEVIHGGGGVGEPFIDGYISGQSDQLIEKLSALAHSVNIHLASPFCWCKPTCIAVDDSGNGTYKHNAQEGLTSVSVGWSGKAKR